MGAGCAAAAWTLGAAPCSGVRKQAAWLGFGLGIGIGIGLGLGLGSGLGLGLGLGSCAMEAGGLQHAHGAAHEGW